MAVFAALGVVLLAVGLGIAIVAGRVFTATERVEGQVVGLRQNEEAFAPDIAYTTREGQARVFHSGVATSPPYPIGARVPIVYDPADPEWAALDTRGDRWLLPTIFGGTGGFFLLLGALGLLQDRRHRRAVAALLRQGARVDATILAVDHERSDEFERDLWRIRCSVQLPGEAQPRLVASEWLWHDPRPHLAGKTLQVCYDPRTPDRLLLDTSVLPAQ